LGRFRPCRARLLGCALPGRSRSAGKICDTFNPSSRPIAQSPGTRTLGEVVASRGIDADAGCDFVYRMAPGPDTRRIGQNTLIDDLPLAEQQPLPARSPRCRAAICCKQPCRSMSMDARSRASSLRFPSISSIPHQAIDVFTSVSLVWPAKWSPTASSAARRRCGEITGSGRILTEASTRWPPTSRRGPQRCADVTIAVANGDLSKRYHGRRARRILN